MARLTRRKTNYRYGFTKAFKSLDQKYADDFKTIVDKSGEEVGDLEPDESED